jgi:hypothetical protein
VKQDWKKSHNRSIIIGAIVGPIVLVVVAVTMLLIIEATIEYVCAPGRHDEYVLCSD